MAIILPESYGDELAFSADEALHPEFWEPHRPVSVFCPLLGPTGNRLIDYAGGSTMTISNYASSMWGSDGLKFNGTNQYAARASKIRSYPLTVFCSLKGQHSYEQKIWTIGNPSNHQVFIATYFETNKWQARSYDGTTRNVISATYGGSYDVPVIVAGKFSQSFRNVYLNGVGSTPNIDPDAVNMATIGNDVIGKYYSAAIHFYSNKLLCLMVYNDFIEDDTIYLISQELRQDPLAPFRKRPLRRFIFIGGAAPQTATAEQVTWAWSFGTTTAANQSSQTATATQVTWSWIVSYGLAKLATQYGVADQVTWAWSFGATTAANQSALDATAEQVTWAWSFGATSAVLEGASLEAIATQLSWLWTFGSTFAKAGRFSRIDAFLDPAIPRLRRLLGETNFTIFGETIPCVVSRQPESLPLGIGGRTEQKSVRVYFRQNDMPAWITVDANNIFVDSTSITSDTHGYKPRTGNKITLENETFRVRQVTQSGDLGHWILDCESPNI